MLKRKKDCDFSTGKLIKNNIGLYLLLIPGLIFIILFKYIPIGGLTMAFQDYNVFQGISGSEWVGLKHFERLFTSPDFYRVFWNTLIISVYKLFITFPLPIILALIVNEISNKYFKRFSQTVVYLPHFLSWIIVAGLFTNILSPSGGLVNNIITALGGESIPFMISNDWFRSVLVFTDAWKESGWGAIIYIAAITGIDQEQFEAATVDGATKLQKIWYITLPSIAGTIVLMFILKLGSIMSGGFDQVLAMYNPTVYETADIIPTYVYRMGIGKMEYSFSTAVGMFNSVIGFVLVMFGNFFSRKVSDRSIW